MTLLSNYIFRQVWGATLTMTFGLSLLVLLTQSLRFLDLMISAGAAPGAFFMMLALSLPRLVEIIMPIALAVSLLIIVLKLHGDHELAVMQATGAGPWRIAQPILAAAVLTSALLATLSFWLTPLSIATLQSQRQIIQAQFSLSLLQPGVFNFFGDDIMIYFDRHDDEGRLVNLILHDQRDQKRPYTLMAERGELMSDGETYRLNIANGRRQQLNEAARVVDQLSFSRYEIELPKTVRDIAPRWKEPDERSLVELVEGPRDDIDNNNREELFAELHRRLAAPFIPLSLALPLLWLLLRTVRPRQSAIGEMAIGLAYIGGYQTLFLVAVAAAERSALAVAGIYAIALLPFLWTMWRLCPDMYLKRSMPA